MAKKRWADLSAGQRAGLVVLAAVQVGLLVAALWDLAHRSADEIRGDKRMWVGLVFINWIGPLAYFCIGRKGCACCPPCCCGSRTGEEEAEATEDEAPAI
jgi:hypothetical protein